MATIQNDRDVLLQAAATRLETVAGPTNVTVDFAQVNGATKPSNNADVTTTILTASGTSIVMNNANLFKSGSGLGGVFIGSGGLFGKNSGGTETFAIDAGTGDVRFAGNINTAGQAVFGGNNTTGGYTSAMHVNLGGGSVNGIVSYASGFAAHAVRGIAAVDACAVLGEGTLSASGVQGTSSGVGGVGVLAVGASGAYALSVVGTTVIDNSTVTWNGYTYSAPAGSSTTCLHNDGVWRDPVTTARVNAAFGASESDVLQIVVCDSGTATVGGSGINLTTTIGGVRFRATGGNNIVLETFP